MLKIQRSKSLLENSVPIFDPVLHRWRRRFLRYARGLGGFKEQISGFESECPSKLIIVGNHLISWYYKKWFLPKCQSSWKEENKCVIYVHTPCSFRFRSWNKFLIGELFFMIHFTRSKCSKHLQVEVPYIYIQILHMNVWIVCLGPNIGSQWEPNHYYFTIRDLKMNLHDNPLRIRGNGQDPNNYMYRCKGNKYVWPIGSMYGVFTYIWLKFTVKVCKYHTWILCVRLKICSFLGDGSGVSSTHITGR